MFKPDELVPKEVWTVVLSKLPTEDKLSCRPVCSSFKKQVDCILKKNQDRLWLRHRKGEFGHYFCYEKDHKITSRDTLYYGKTITIKDLKFVSKLMPSLKILHFDPLHQVHREDYDKHKYLPLNFNVPNYRDEKEEAVPITKIFPQVACLILPGTVEKKKFVGDLSQIKHLTLFDVFRQGSPTFSNLDSLEVHRCESDTSENLPIPSKRFVVPLTPTDWRTLPKTLEVIETDLNCDEYISVGRPHFENLKILKGPFGQNLYTLIYFFRDHKEFLTELSFSAERSTEEEVAAIKGLVPLLSQLQKLSVMIKTDKQAIELKEIKVLAHNLQYFELMFSVASFGSSNMEHLGPLLENLPIGLDNFSINGVWYYNKISSFMEKIMEKIVNGDTKRITIAALDDGSQTRNIMEEIMKISPSPVRVEKSISKNIVDDDWDCCFRTQMYRTIFDIVISL